MNHHPSIIIQILPMYSSSTKVSIQALPDVCIHHRPSSTHPNCCCKVIIHQPPEKYPSKLLRNGIVIHQRSIATNSVVMHHKVSI
jgi:hypothetical protein